MNSGLYLAGLAAGLAVGGARGLIAWGFPACDPLPRPAGALLVRGSLPLLALGSALVFLWPGNLAAPFLGGPLQILAGLAMLAFSFLFLERARLAETGLHLCQDPWIVPRRLRPLGATWGVREECLAALLLAPLLAYWAQGRGVGEGLGLLAGAWAGLVLPGLGLAALRDALERSARLRSDRPCCLLRPRLYRMLSGLAGLALVAAGAVSLYRGVGRLVLSWPG